MEENNIVNEVRGFAFVTMSGVCVLCSFALGTDLRLPKILIIVAAVGLIGFCQFFSYYKVKKYFNNLKTENTEKTS